MHGLKCHEIGPIIFEHFRKIATLKRRIPLLELNLGRVPISYRYEDGDWQIELVVSKEIGTAHRFQPKMKAALNKTEVLEPILRRGS